MSLLSWLGGSSDRQLAETRYAGRESATDRAARVRRERHRARVIRDGDASGIPVRRRKRND